MKKALSWIWDNILFLETLFILVFIPLFPKIPVLDIKNTWVYIRTEDFIVFFVFITLLIKEKITFKTPITLPILAFWTIGAIATMHGVLLVFPEISNAYPNVAFLSLLRHIEYISVFFIAYAGIRNKKQLIYIIGALVFTLIAVIIYGFGQKYLGFPAFLTMNEEFAKGIPIQLSALSRVPSTFAGHYDLAAYLVLVIPILVSLFFGFKNWLIKIGLLVVSFFGFILLFMTVSRVSFVVLFAALFVVFLFQKKKLILLSIPLAIIFGIFVLTFQSSLFDRFKSTVSEVDVVVDAQTGESLGHVKFTPKEYLQDKLVLQKRVKDRKELNMAIEELEQDSDYYSSTSAILQYRYIPPEIPLVTAVNVSTGESLGQGTGYINLYLSPVVKRIGNFYLELPPDVKSSPSAQVLVLHGDFIVKRAAAYDLSFTTRFQGEWPNAIEAFKRNILFGSGYGSISLAIDNNYLRILGEIGLLGFISFFLIFLILAIYIKKVYPSVDSRLARCFIIGFGAGFIGLALNALLIDVFEASKIAFLLWALTGVTFGILALYQKHDFSLLNEVKKAALSPLAIIIYLFLGSLVLYSPTLNNYFVGDDFTWLRWAADCGSCNPVTTITNYFTNSDGFFYRPGTKTFFYFMYNMFWLNQVVYHLASLVLHFAVAVLVFLIARKIFKNNILSGVAAFLFLVASGGTEAVLWISSIGTLFISLFGLLGLLLFIEWDEKKKIYFIFGSFASFSLALLFQEQAVILPLLIPAYLVSKNISLRNIKTSVMRWDFLVMFIPVIAYLIARFISKSHWSGGDYSYDLLMLPFNFVGNLIGYLMLTIAGPMALSISNSLRSAAKDNLILFAVALPLVIAAVYLMYKFIYKSFDNSEKRIVIFGLLFFTICLLPFLGLGNIASRYDYLGAVGIIFIITLILKKAYDYLLPNGREIAVATIAVIVGIYSLFHVMQIQQTYFIWEEAGNKVRNFFISFDASYSSNWSKPDAEFYFVNVPIKVGEAWVFPVGLNDAVWFAIKNDKAKINISSDLDTAIEQAGYYKSRTVFEFDNNGNVKEIDRFKEVPSYLIKQ
jgi:hypothetical protein